MGNGFWRRLGDGVGEGLGVGELGRWSGEGLGAGEGSGDGDGEGLGAGEGSGLGDSEGGRELVLKTLKFLYLSGFFAAKWYAITPPLPKPGNEPFSLKIIRYLS